MNVNVWLVYRAGEPRVYTWTVQPDEERLNIWRSEGFQVFRAEIDLPVDEDTRKVGALASLVPPPPVAATGTEGLPAIAAEHRGAHIIYGPDKPRVFEPFMKLYPPEG